MRTKMILMALAALALAGCSKTVTWKEEVQLSDGRVIVVERETLRVSGGPELAHGGSGTSPKEERIRFEFPHGSGQEVEWHSTRMSGMGWPETPLILDFEVDTPYVITLNSGGGCLYYSMYVYQRNAWSEKALEESIPQRKSNLFLKSGPGMGGLIQLALKDKESNSNHYDKTLRIVGPAKAICANKTSQN